MRVRINQTVSPKPELRITYIKMAVVGLALGTIAAFTITFLLNTLGMFGESVAGKKTITRYPFDVSDESMKKVKFTALSNPINSTYSEVRPYISSKGTELFFSRRNHPGNINGTKDDQDIWVSLLQKNGQWSIPQNLGEEVNSKKADAICSISPDGSEILFFTESLDPNKILQRITLSDKGWSKPEYIAIEEFYSLEPYVDFYYSYENNVLLTGVSRNDSNGEQDLYISFPLGKNKWSEPKNLGSVVNSSKSDFAPFLSKDGKTLYFSSYGHKGLGGCDIFQTSRLDDTWENWSAPVNLGEGINSEREESYFTISGDYKHIYFESYNIQNQIRDIFRAELPAVFKPGDLTARTVLVKN